MMANTAYLQPWEMAQAQSTAQGMVWAILKHLKPGSEVNEVQWVFMSGVNQDYNGLRVKVMNHKYDPQFQISTMLHDPDPLLLVAYAEKWTDGNITDSQMLDLHENRWETIDGLDPDEYHEVASDTTMWPKRWASEVAVILRELRQDPELDDDVPRMKYQTVLVVDDREVALMNHYSHDSAVRYTEDMMHIPFFYCSKCNKPTPLGTPTKRHGKWSTTTDGISPNPVSIYDYICPPCYNTYYRGHEQKDDPEDKQ